MSSAPESPIPAAQAMARVRAARLALLDLHKTLIDIERVRYEHSRGRIESPHHALQLLMNDPFFAWLRPLAQTIIQFDEWLADEHARRARASGELLASAARVLSDPGGTGPFAHEYRRALQDSPDVVVAHARAVALLAVDD
jgi:plasmid stabilization system protein ParE